MNKLQFPSPKDELYHNCFFVCLKLQLLGRTIRVDHVEKYKVPKEHGDEDDITKKLRKEGIAPKVEEGEEEDSEEEDYVISIKKHKKG